MRLSLIKDMLELEILFCNFLIYLLLILPFIHCRRINLYLHYTCLERYSPPKNPRGGHLNISEREKNVRVSSDRIVVEIVLVDLSVCLEL